MKTRANTPYARISIIQGRRKSNIPVCLVQILIHYLLHFYL
ncbi:hypothetical protein CLOHYLEM_06519 [[Clostridium] hylemonae DSM 15053]|uniref:Uncharacterized protein n=1 Tax=[Clostridium] hylemonae DSM 15053 TaxID=553973 RepID=C0C359_9FIRM|nr:hypothetical protein CLOHYLEM_06519 [[Clostridium] hylemonae DSM 15053]